VIARRVVLLDTTTTTWRRWRHAVTQYWSYVVTYVQGAPI